MALTSAATLAVKTSDCNKDVKSGTLASIVYHRPIRAMSRTTAMMLAFPMFVTMAPARPKDPSLDIEEESESLYRDLRSSKLELLVGATTKIAIITIP